MLWRVDPADKELKSENRQFDVCNRSLAFLYVSVPRGKKKNRDPFQIFHCQLVVGSSLVGNPIFFWLWGLHQTLHTGKRNCAFRCAVQRPPSQRIVEWPVSSISSWFVHCGQSGQCWCAACRLEVPPTRCGVAVLPWRGLVGGARRAPGGTRQHPAWSGSCFVQCSIPSK